MLSTIPNKKIFAYLFNIVKQFKLTLIIMGLLAFIFAFDTSYRPFLLKIILDKLSNHTDQSVLLTLKIPILLYLGLYLVIITLYRVNNYYIDIKAWPQMRVQISNDIFKLLLNKSYDFYQDNLSGNLTNRVNELSEKIPGLFRLIINSFFTNLLTLIIAVITLCKVNIYFGLLMLGWAILFIICCIFLSKKLNILSAKWAGSRSNMVGTLVDILSNILPVFLFANKTTEQQNFCDSLIKIKYAEQKLQWLQFGIWGFYTYSFFILQATELYLLCKNYDQKLVTAGDFALVIMVNIAVAGFLGKLAEDFADIAKIWGNLKQGLAIIFNEHEIKDMSNAQELRVDQGEIQFINVEYNYKDKNKLFNNLSLTIQGGQKIGLVGYSGGGKSSFVNLILRLYELNSGSILIDNQNINEVKQNSLRQNITIIPQDSSLFHRSLIENIRYGKITATDEEVFTAAKFANIHDFIINLPLGYNSLVGERGLRLSGGQRQRISIARAFLKNAPILILDEATSSLDSLTEQYIQESFNQLMVNKTTIIIAHRLSTLLNVDRILVFKEGKIIEDGNHSQLILNNSLYQKLWKGQVSGFLPDKL